MAALDERAVESTELSEQYATRPRVVDDVMHDGREQMLFGSEAQKLGSKERSAGQVEGPLSLFENARLGKPFPFGAGKAGQIFYSQRPSIDRFDALNRLAAVSGKVVRSESCRRTISSSERSNASIGGPSSSRTTARCRGRARRELVENHSRCCANERARRSLALNRAVELFMPSVPGAAHGWNGYQSAICRPAWENARFDQAT
jgi:hypothetical protein